MKQTSLHKTTAASRLFPLLLIALGIGLSLFLLKGTTVHAAEPRSFGTEFSINPLYEDVLTESEQEELLTDAESIDESAATDSSENTFHILENGTDSPRLESAGIYTDASEASAYMRDLMVSRQNTLILTYKFSYSGFSSLSEDERETICTDVASDLFWGAFAHTGVSGEGDYLRWNYTLWKLNSNLSNYTSKGDNVTLSLGYSVSYYTTASQEAQLNEALETAEASLGLSENASDYDKISAIYRYITSNVSYDYGKDAIKYTAYSAMINHKAVCEGFSALFYRMALDCGLDARMVSGYGGNANHGWNIVKLGASYYYLDSTWDSLKTTWSYFLLGSTGFLKNHTLATSGELASTSAELVACYSIYDTDFDISDYNPDYGTGLYDLNGQQTYYIQGIRSHTTGVTHIGTSWYNLNDGIVTPGPTVAKNSSGWWYIDQDGKVDFSFNGLARNSSGWWYIKNGMVDFTYNGFARNSSGWWYIKNGMVDFTYNGFAQNEYGWWYFENGKINASANSVIKGTVAGVTGWWHVADGKVDFSNAVFAENSNGWWYIENGKVNFSVNSVIKGTVDGVTGWWHVAGGKVTYDTTVAKNSSGWWYIKDGRVDFSFSGFAQNSNGWWYIQKGKVDFSVNSVIKGTVAEETAWWHIINGKVTYDTTVAKNSSGWWYIKNGRVDFSFRGIASNANGSWYLSGGKVQFGYTGTVTYLGKTYRIVKGKVS